MDRFLKPVVFAFICFVWMIAVLTLLGPAIGGRFISDVDAVYYSGYPQFESLTCPEWLAPRSPVTIVARFTNRSGRTQHYRVYTKFYSAGVTRHCESEVELSDGETGTAECSLAHIYSTPIVVRAVASGSVSGSNAFWDMCVITPDPWTRFANIWNLITVVTGLVVIVIGLAFLGGSSRAVRIVLMTIGGVTFLLMLAVLGGWRGPWLVAVMDAAIFALPIGVVLMARRRRQGQTRFS